MTRPTPTRDAIQDAIADALDDGKVLWRGRDIGRAADAVLALYANPEPTPTATSDQRDELARELTAEDLTRFKAGTILLAEAGNVWIKDDRYQWKCTGSAYPHSSGEASEYGPFIVLRSRALGAVVVDGE